MELQLLRQIAAARKGINLSHHVKPNRQNCRAQTGYNEEASEEMYKNLYRNYAKNEQSICHEVRKLKERGILISEWISCDKPKCLENYVQKEVRSIVEELSQSVNEYAKQQLSQSNCYSPSGRKIGVKQRLQMRHSIHQQQVAEQQEQRRKAFERKLANEQRNINPLLTYRQPFPKIDRSFSFNPRDEKKQMALLNIERDLHRKRQPIPTFYLLTDEERQERVNRGLEIKSQGNEKVLESLRKNDRQHKRLKQRIANERILDY